MHTRIEKDFYFQTAVHFGGRFYINVYDIALSMLIETESGREQHVAMDRLTHFLEEVLQNSILVCEKSAEAIEKYKEAGITICSLPEEPYDQIFAMVLLMKLNSILENRIKITDMILASTMSEGVKYSIVSEVAEGILSRNRWWNKPNLSMCECVEVSSPNIVKLFDNDDWVDLGLTWKEKQK